MKVQPRGDLSFVLVPETEYEKNILTLYGGKVYAAVHTMDGNLGFSEKSEISHLEKE